MSSSSFQDKDYYSTLGISNIATQEEVKSAYKKLALNWHPDRNKEPGADEMFKIISEAYEILSCPEKKSKYDDYINSRVFQNNYNAREPNITTYGVHFGPDFTMSYPSNLRPYQNSSSYVSNHYSSTWNPYSTPYSSLRASYPNGLYSNAFRQPQKARSTMSGVVNLTKDNVSGVNRKD